MEKTLTMLLVSLLLVLFSSSFIFAQTRQNITDGDLITTSMSLDIYIVKIVGNKKFKRLILNPVIFNSYGHLKWENVITVSQFIQDEFLLSELVQEINLDGSIADLKVYRVTSSLNSDNGERRWMNLTASEFEQTGYDWDSIFHVNHTEALPGFYPTREALTFSSIKNPLRSTTAIQEPHVIPPTTQQLTNLRRFCLSDSFLNSTCQNPVFMPGYYDNLKFRVGIDDIIMQYNAILVDQEKQRIAFEEATLDCLMAITPENERMLDPATQNYLRQVRCRTVTDADKTNYELSRINSSVDELKYRLDLQISFPSFYLDPIQAPTFTNPRWEIRWDGSGGTVTDSSGSFYRFHCESNTCKSY